MVQFYILTIRTGIELVPLGTDNMDFFTDVLNSQGNISRPKSRENAKSQGQGDPRDESVVIEGSRNGAKSEETIDLNLELFGTVTEERCVASSAVPEKCATPRLSQVFSPGNGLSISTDCESQNWSTMFEDCASSVSFSVPSTLEDSVSSLLPLMDNSDFDFDFLIDTPLGDPNLPSEYCYLIPAFSWGDDSIPLDLSLTYNDGCFESAEVPCSEHSFLSNVNYKNSLFSKSKSPKSEFKKPQPRYPCSRCHKYDGPRAFTRKDHLQQHLRTFHSVPKEELIPSFCPHSDCPESAANATSKVFKTIVEYRRHLLVVHGASMFECKMPGCSRVGRCGFARETNLKKHMERYHPGDGKAEEERGSYFWRDRVDLIQYN